MTLVSVLGIPEYVSKGRIDAGVAVVVCRVVPKVRVRERRQMMWCAQLRHTIGYRRGKRCAGVRWKLSGLGSRGATRWGVVSAQLNTSGHTIRERADSVGAGSLEARNGGI